MTDASPAYAVGDIHGCLDQLRSVLDAISADARERGIARPRVVFLGDYADRGPDSKGVLDLLSGDELGQRFDPVFLLGNHDQALISILRGAAPSVDWVEAEGGRQTMESYGDFRARRPELTAKRFRATVPEAHKRFLGDLHLCWREEGLFFSHAGFSPAHTLEEQTFGALVYGDHRMLGIPVNQGAELRQCLGALVVHGHWTGREVVVLPHRVAIDTGAGNAYGRLSAVALDGGMVRVLKPARTTDAGHEVMNQPSGQAFC